MAAPRTLPPLTDEQRAQVEANLGLCGWAVNRWYRYETPGYSREDAFQDAVFGLAAAVRGFDPDRGYRFATYAAAWLHRSIVRGRGIYEGKGRRAVQAGTATEADLPVMWSLDFLFTDLGPDGEGQHALADLPDPHDHETALEVRLQAAEVLALRDQVCRGAIDVEIFDAIADPTDTRAETRRFEEIATRWGLTREAVRLRWKKIRRRIHRELGIPEAPR